MLDGLVQQFMGGQADSLTGEALHGNVGQMVQQAPNNLVMDAVSAAMGQLGPKGFGQSVQEAASGAGPAQRNSVADTLLRAVSQGGGSPNNVLSNLGIGGQSLGPAELGQLATHVAENHPSALAGVLGNQMNSGGGQSGLMSLLGNPMVRQVGMQLAQKLMK